MACLSVQVNEFVVTRCGRTYNCPPRTARSSRLLDDMNLNWIYSERELQMKDLDASHHGFELVPVCRGNRKRVNTSTETCSDEFC